MESGDKVSRLLEDKGRQVFSVAPDTTVKDAAALMAERHVGAILVQHAGKVVGIFSERDLLTRVVLKSLPVEKTTLREVMSADLVYITSDTPICEAMAVMTERRCRHLPVMDGGEVIGMVSIGDCTRWASLDQDYTIRHLQDYIQNKYPG